MVSGSNGQSEIRRTANSRSSSPTNFPDDSNSSINGGLLLLNNNNNNSNASLVGNGKLGNSLNHHTLSSSAATSRKRFRHHSTRGNPNDPQFHPKLITAQIVALQCFQYVVHCFCLQLNAIVWQSPANIDRIFTDKHLHVWRREGWPDCAALMAASLIGALGLAWIVEKSKKCLDFTVTYFLLHLMLSCLYGGVPATTDWWLVHLAGVIVMVVLGEYLCSLRELRDIPLLQL